MKILCLKDCAIKIKVGLPRFIKLSKPKEILVSVYPIERKVKQIYKNEEEIDLLPLVENYNSRLSASKLVKRVKKVMQNEWNVIHKNKKPSEVYSDRVEKDFPEKYKARKKKVEPIYIS